MRACVTSKNSINDSRVIIKKHAHILFITEFALKVLLITHPSTRNEVASLLSCNGLLGKSFIESIEFQHGMFQTGNLVVDMNILFAH